MTKVSEIGTGATRVLGIRRNQESGALPLRGLPPGVASGRHALPTAKRPRGEPAELRDTACLGGKLGGNGHLPGGISADLGGLPGPGHCTSGDIPGLPWTATR